MRNFKELKIWELGMEIVIDIYFISKELPDEEKYGLRSQITRAAVSIPSNIAEGCSRNSNIDFNRFLQITLGSLYELETQLILIKELKIIEDENKLNHLFEKIENESKMINGFMSKIKSFKRPKT